MESSHLNSATAKKKLLFYPFLVSTCLLLVFVYIWHLYAEQELEFKRKSVAFESKRIGNEFLKSLNETSFALKRFATRIEYFGDNDLGYLELDSQSYLNQLPLLKRIGLINPQNKVYWSFPKDISSQVMQFNQSDNPVRFRALTEAKERREPALSEVVELRSGGPGFIMPIALFQKDKFFGFFYATIDAKKLSHSVNMKPEVGLSIFQSKKLLFQHATSKKADSRFAVKSEIHWGGVKFELLVEPSEAYFDSFSTNISALILGFGFLLSSLLGFLLHRILVSRQDMNDKKLAQELVAASTDRLKRVIEATGEGVWEREFTQNPKITYYDSQIKKIFGFDSHEELHYDEVASLVAPEHIPQIAQELQNHLEGKRGYFEIECRIRHPKDKTNWKWIRTRGKIITRENQVPLLVSTVKDVTDEIEQREQLKVALVTAEEATKAKSFFLANMSHEIRTPLNGVIGMAGLLIDSKLDEVQSEYARTILGSGEILLNLINDILDFSKIEAGKLDIEVLDFDVEEVTRNIERLMEFSAKKKGLKLVRRISPDLKEVTFKGDPNRLGQVLTNLLSNAIKFTTMGEVLIEVTEEKEASLPSHQTRLKIAVTDSGIGLSEKDMAKMFVPFSQADVSTSRRFGGTGLGLSICRHLTEMMGGNISVSSEENVGSTFTFTVLVERGSKISSPVEILDPTTFELDGEKIRVLLVEDNQVNQLIGKKMLEKLGLQVEIAANGVEAIEVLNMSSYDLVFMDCQMPVLDGYETTMRIRANQNTSYVSVPIIAMTANAMSGDRERCLAVGMNDYVTKPINIHDLTAVLRKTLGHRLTSSSETKKVVC